VRRVITALAGLIPNQAKEILLGSPSKPSWMAGVIHGILNRIPGEPFPCLPCAGILEGYRMMVEWTRFRAFAYGTWEPEVVKAVIEVVHEGFVAIDVGAHLGYYALILSRLVGSNGRVIAFEPIPSNFRILSENIELNGCKNVQVVNQAVSDRSGCCELAPHALSNSSSFSLLKNGGTKTIAVDAISLDDFLKDWHRPIDFIEIDVEGAEGMVLDGARKTIESYHPVLLVEIHHFGSCLESSQVPRQLMELDYELRWLLKWEDTSHVLATWKGGSQSKGLGGRLETLNAMSGVGQRRTVS
jgi:FkbM family methyltransferase